MLTYANVMSTIAVVVALGTGSAYAASTIGSADVIDESLIGADVKNGSITGGDVAQSTITNYDVLNNSLIGADVFDNSLKGADVDEGSLGTVPSASSAAHATTAGEAAVQDYQVIFRHAPFDQVVRKSRSFEVDCPAGKRPIAGGGHARSSAVNQDGTDVDGAEVAIVESHPSGGMVYGEDDVRPRGWMVRAQATDRTTYNAAINLTVYVVCAKTDMP